MYIQAIWRQDGGGTGSIAQVVEVDSWITASLKLPDLYGGFKLTSLNNPPFAVDKVDTTGNCYICTFNQGGSQQTVYIFDKTFEGAYEQIRRTYFVEPDSIAETQLTYKNEKS